MKVLRLFLVITISVVYVSCAQQKTVGELPDKPVAIEVEEGKAVATFAGGCFWCTEAIFERVEGVTSSVSGYAGGKEVDPTYEDVSYGRTSHAEAVQVIYDPKVVSYAQLLKIFFATHDPTQLNRQGPDVGEQYRSAVFYHNDEQQQLLEDYVDELNSSGKYSKKIVTQQVPYVNFYEAEKYHQNYYEYNPNQSYIYNVSRPKVEKLLKLFPELVKKQYLK